MNGDSQKLNRRRRSWLIVGAFVLGITALLAVRSHLRCEREQAIVQKIRSRGGHVDVPPTVLDNLRHLWDGREWVSRSDTHVFFASGMDSKWVRKHGFLADMEIESLTALSTVPDSETLGHVIAAHPISNLGVVMRRDADVIAEALSAKSSLQCVRFSKSLLTDSGLKRLPLEQLEVLQVDRTNVTPLGLEELERCDRLEHLELDGGQFTDTVCQIVAKMPRLEVLYLVGQPPITDETIPRLGRCQNVRYLLLANRELTSDGIKALKAAMPNCVINAGRPL